MLRRIQSRDTTNHIRRISAGEAFSVILNQMYGPANRGVMVQTFSLAERMLAEIPVYSLGCTISREAVRVSLNGMRGEEI